MRRGFLSGLLGAVPGCSGGLAFVQITFHNILLLSVQGLDSLKLRETIEHRCRPMRNIC